MSDFIRRQNALDALKEYEVVESDNFTKTDPISKMTVATIANCIEVIWELPSIKPEQKKGKWIDEKPNMYTRKVYCSECGCMALSKVKSEGDVYNPRYIIEFAKSNFCPYCGADMRGE